MFQFKQSSVENVSVGSDNEESLNITFIEFEKNEISFLPAQKLSQIVLVPKFKDLANKSPRKVEEMHAFLR